MTKVLVVDDDKNILSTLKVHLEDSGMEPVLAETGKNGLQRFMELKPEIVLLDLKLPDIDGLEVLKEIVATEIKTFVVIITAYATIDTAVKAVKIGAFDYLPKPFTPSQVTHLLEMVKKVSSLESEVETLKEKLKGVEREGDFLTRNKKVRGILKTARQVADSNASVLISGESGTGKGILARLIHDWSSRKDGPFVIVDCTVLQDNLLESDLFGHVRGAFTGAIRDKVGKLKTADVGTVFLDEVADMSPGIQAKLLHFLEHHEFSKLGDTETLKVDVRVIAATNRDLDGLVQEKVFRQDLYYRLHVLEIFMPPLRERVEDIPLLVQHYLKRFARNSNKDVKGISDQTMQLLQTYPWPGNIRELINVIERATILSTDDLLKPEAIPSNVVNYSPGEKSSDVLKPLSEVEKAHIKQVLLHTQSIEEAAQVLGIDPATLWRKRKKYHLD
ncbi:MAG: sigma-54-dependent Fis family transcriptional regulator [Deltaproteobacteria bacterium]|nr:MAG: sigma-54-dependent Fis family transcriptional regulator [Deltaproteobacteria bacterium]